MHAYRTHTCGQLRSSDVGQTVRLSGWVNRRRDHGGLIFIDLRDHYGITQCVIEPDGAAFPLVDTARSEWVLTLTGKVVARGEGGVLRRDDALGDAVMIAQVDEDQPAMVAAAIDPAGDARGGADIGFAKLAAGVGAIGVHGRKTLRNLRNWPRLWRFLGVAVDFTTLTATPISGERSAMNTLGTSVKL